MPVSRTQAAHLLWNDRRFFSIFIDAKEKGGVYKSKTGERERESVKEKECDKVINGRSQEHHATFTHRIHLKNVCVFTSSRVFSGIFRRCFSFFKSNDFLLFPEMRRIFLLVRVDFYINRKQNVIYIYVCIYKLCQSCTTSCTKK